jgi:hypothetical protein
MSSDFFTKNLAGPLLEQRMQAFCGVDQYMRNKDYPTLKGRVSESNIESKGEYVPKYVSHKKPFVNPKTQRTDG